MRNTLKTSLLSSSSFGRMRSTPATSAVPATASTAFLTFQKDARRSEEAGDWVAAASAWKRLCDAEVDGTCTRLAVIIEYAYAMLKAFESAGTRDSLSRPALRQVLDEIRKTIFDRPPCSIGRPALFKGLDLLWLDYTPGIDAQFLLLAGANLDDDVELRNKFLDRYTGVPGACTWILDDGIAAQRINIFNNIVLDASRHFVDRPHIGLFFRIRRYAAQCLALARTPSAEDIRRIVIDNDAGEPAFEPVEIPTELPALTAFLDHSLADLSASLAFFHPGLLIDIAATTKSDTEFARAVRAFTHLMPRYCIITQLGYPMGGGESFMHQSAAMLREFGFQNVWVSFTDKSGTPYSRLSAATTPYYWDVRIPGGIDERAISAAITDYAADIVHSQGISNALVATCAQHLRVPCFIGFHFWQGLVDLGFTRNQKIVENISLHASADAVKPSRDTVRYVASEFMAQVFESVGGTGPLEVFHPVPDPSHYCVSDQQRKTASFVTQINLAEGKGGRFFLACLEALGTEGIPFLGVHSEEVDNELLGAISAAITQSPGSSLETYGPAKAIYARSKLLIIPTLVDETFCRVAFEAAANGIPVLSTRAGFIPLMLGDSGYYLPDDDPKSWIDAIRTLYGDAEQLAAIGRRQQKRVLTTFGKYPKGFLDATIACASHNTRRKNIGFFTSWNDQGLGCQVRHYSHLLREAGFRTHVFSFLPYKAIGTGLTNQREEADWATPRHADTVYYSYNDREHVPVSEISQFVKANRIGTLIYPEICWEANWENLEQLQVPGLFLLGVPNLEIVRRGEAARHGSVLTRTLCPTQAVEQILYSHGVRNTHYIGHGYGRSLSEEWIRSKLSQLGERDVIRFLHIGGHNPLSRKQTPAVLEAFMLALKQRDDIRLTVTLMDPHNIDLPRHQNIDYVKESIAHDDIMELYSACDVSIQVSSHEGVGMGFYESIAMGTPIISLDVPPHNEVVLDRLTGWLVPAFLVPLPDNDDPVSRAARFDIHNLASLVVSLNKSTIADMIRSTAEVHGARFNEVSLKLRLVGGLV